jgi:hypothetical protein
LSVITTLISEIIAKRETSTIPKRDITMAQSKTSRDEAIRSRLLNTLGIHKPLQQLQQNQSATASSASTETRSDADSTSSSNNNNINTPLFGRDGRVDAFRQSLNDAHEEHNRPTHVRRLSRKRLVRFDSDVMVQPIASHKNYSKRIKNTIWTDAVELQDNAYRNQVEFAAEGWDYQKVLEDEDMYIDAETGELVHPYWIEQEQQHCDEDVVERAAILSS